MTDYITNDTDLTVVADAIRQRGGTTASISYPSGFASAILAIPSGGAEYETGVYAPTADSTDEQINFTDTHSEAPSLICMADYTTSSKTPNSSMVEWMFCNVYKLFGSKATDGSQANFRAGYLNRFYVASNGSQTANVMQFASTQDTASTTQSNTGYIARKTDFVALGISNIYFRAGRTYKWIAIWM